MLESKGISRRLERMTYMVATHGYYMNYCFASLLQGFARARFASGPLTSRAVLSDCFPYHTMRAP